jgi:hypothetical protein
MEKNGYENKPFSLKMRMTRFIDKIIFITISMDGNVSVYR